MTGFTEIVLKYLEQKDNKKGNVWANTENMKMFRNIEKIYKDNKKVRKCENMDGKQWNTLQSLKNKKCSWHTIEFFFNMALNDLTFSIVEYTFTQIQTFSCSVKHTTSVVVGLIAFRGIVVRKIKNRGRPRHFILIWCVFNDFQTITQIQIRLVLKSC